MIQEKKYFLGQVISGITDEAEDYQELLCHIASSEHDCGDEECTLGFPRCHVMLARFSLRRYCVDWNKWAEKRKRSKK